MKFGYVGWGLASFAYLCCQTLASTSFQQYHAYVQPTSFLAVQAHEQPIDIIGPVSPLSAAKTAGPILHDPLISSINPSGQSGYVPNGSPYDNINNDMLSQPAFALPENSECTIRTQTVVQIQKVRKTAAQMAAAIGLEAGNMGKRKTWIEEMTSFINDRIRELNKIKSDLKEDLRWVSMTRQQIDLLNKQEQKMKLDDVLNCMQSDKSREMGRSQQAAEAAKALKVTADSLNKVVAETQKQILDIQSGKNAGGSSAEASQGKA